MDFYIIRTWTRKCMEEIEEAFDYDVTCNANEPCIKDGHMSLVVDVLNNDDDRICEIEYSVGMDGRPIGFVLLQTKGTTFEAIKNYIKEHLVGGI